MPRKLGYLEYSRRVDNPCIGRLFHDASARTNNLSVSLTCGATPVKVSRLNLIRRVSHPDPASDSSDEEDHDAWRPPGGQRGYYGEPLTPLGRALDAGLARCREKSGDGNGDEDLVMAAREGDLARVKRLLAEKKEALCGARDGSGRGALVWGAALGHESITREILMAQDGRDELVDLQGSSALMWACREGHTEVVRALLGGKVDVDHQNVGYRKSPLMWAAHQAHPKIVDLLLDHRANVHLVCSEGCTALHYAGRSGHVGIVHRLVVQGADVNKLDIHGMTVMHYASEKGHVEVVRFLLTLPRSNQEQDGGSTQRCDVSVANKHYQLARDLAENWLSENHKMCVQMLRAREQADQASHAKERRIKREGRPLSRQQGVMPRVV